jgi:hypothetical protein
MPEKPAEFSSLQTISYWLYFLERNGVTGCICWHYDYTRAWKKSNVKTGQRARPVRINIFCFLIFFGAALVLSLPDVEMDSWLREWQGGLGAGFDFGGDLGLGLVDLGLACGTTVDAGTTSPDPDLSAVGSTFLSADGKVKGLDGRDRGDCDEWFESLMTEVTVGAGMESFTKLSFDDYFHTF